VTFNTTLEEFAPPSNATWNPSLNSGLGGWEGGSPADAALIEAILLLLTRLQNVIGLAGAAAGTASHEGRLKTLELGGAVLASGGAAPYQAVTTDSTAGARTYTAAEVLSALVRRDPNGANRSDVLPTAAAVVVAVHAPAVGAGYLLTVRNTADAAETVTLTAGAGATLDGPMVLRQGETRDFLLRLTNIGGGTEAYTLHALVGALATDRLLATPLPAALAATTANTTGARTYTAAEILAGLVLRDPNGANRTDVLPTAASLVALLPYAAVNQGYAFTLRNTADAAEAVTLTAGTGGTLNGTMRVGQGETRTFILLLTNVGSSTEAYTCYALAGAVDPTTALAAPQPAARGTTTANTTGARTYTAAEILAGLIQRDPNGASRADILPTAVSVVAALPYPAVNQGYAFTVQNTADAAEAITLTVAAGGTLSGTMRVGQGETRTFLLLLTNVGSGTEAYTCYALGGAVEPATALAAPQPAYQAVTTVSTAGARTYTAAEVLGGLVLRDCAAADRADTLPTAAAVVQALAYPVVGQGYLLAIRNTSAGAFTVTLGAGTGGTTSGTMTIAQGVTRTFVLRLANVGSGTEAYTIYALVGA
jgi:hypothetical protein